MPGGGRRRHAPRNHAAQQQRAADASMASATTSSMSSMSAADSEVTLVDVVAPLVSSSSFISPPSLPPPKSMSNRQKRRQSKSSFQERQRTPLGTSSLAAADDDITPDHGKTPPPPDDDDAGVHAVTSALRDTHLEEDTTKKPSSSNRMAHLDVQALERLPGWKNRHDVIAAVRAQRVTCVCGETGCGKSTAIPIALLEDAIARKENARIVITQPRRLAAQSLSRRVAKLLGESEVGGLVGFAVGQDVRMSASTRLLFCTTGWLLRSLSGALDEGKAPYTHVVIDEAHERTVDADFLSLTVKALNTVQKRMKAREFKLVVMSATLQASEMGEYFATSRSKKERVPPPLHVGSSMFPVDIMTLDELNSGVLGKQVATVASRVANSHLTRVDMTHSSVRGGQATPKPETGPAVANLINEIVRSTALGASHEKSVLVFLPGVAEIETVARVLESGKQDLLICPLHAQIEYEDQLKALESAPKGMVKVVLSTTIAESSITIPDVYCVIDSCQIKGQDFDDVRQQAVLRLRWASQASATQRSGRAGRVRPGCCVRLLSEMHFRALRPFDEPEMMRCSLEEVVLSTRVLLPALGDAQTVLSTAIDPPPASRVALALQNLAVNGALFDVNGSSTATVLGRFSSLLPVGITGAKMVLLGLALGCETDAIVIATAFSQPLDPFIMPSGAFAKQLSKLVEDVVTVLHRRHELAQDEGSDALVYLNAFDSFVNQTHDRTPNAAWLQCLNFKRMASWHAMATDVARRVAGVSETYGIHISPEAKMRLQRLADSRQKKPSAARKKGRLVFAGPHASKEAEESKQSGDSADAPTTDAIPFCKDVHKLRLILFASLGASGTLYGVPAEPPPSKKKEAEQHVGRIKLKDIPDQLCTELNLKKALEPMTKPLGEPDIFDAKRGAAWLSYPSQDGKDNTKVPPGVPFSVSGESDDEGDGPAKPNRYVEHARDLPFRAKVLASCSQHLARRDEKDKTVIRVRNPLWVPGSGEAEEVNLGRVHFDHALSFYHMEKGKAHVGRWSILNSAACAVKDTKLLLNGIKIGVLACYHSMMAIVNASGTSTTYVCENLTALPPLDTFSAVLWACVAPRSPMLTLLMAPSSRRDAAAVGLAVSTSGENGRISRVELAFSPHEALSPKRLFKRVKTFRKRVDSLFLYGSLTECNGKGVEEERVVVEEESTQKRGRGRGSRRGDAANEGESVPPSFKCSLLEDYEKIVRDVKERVLDSKSLRRDLADWDARHEESLPPIGRGFVATELDRFRDRSPPP